MAPSTGPLWAYFHQGNTKPNKAHYRATHWRCIDARRPQDEPIDVEASADIGLIKKAPWFAAPRARRPRSWLPMTLAELFGGTISRPIARPARRSRVVSEEGLYMELLAAEHSDEEPDAP
ncbi:hypothetical protein GGX14DRAFT_400557 [Mycena pura]|uniref:Uncharacterized protein n=1 Tax=Mycena pura TaxID=153505 RepID=A0AAD6V4F6_9AGAR|nr:hypothetical protein GGX14DRAFT_400557 [Mycena pura]